MCSVRPDRELELEQKLVGLWSVGIHGSPVLAADLAELARPVRQHERLPRVEESGVVGPVRSIVSKSGEPAPRELIVSRHVVAHAALKPFWLVPATPDDFGSPDERPVDRTLQGSPAQFGVDPPQLRRK